MTPTPTCARENMGVGVTPTRPNEPTEEVSE
jgi:hypothetical protein